MKNSEIFVHLGILVTATAASIVWLWFMIAKPERWSQIVDKENDFWVRKGIVPASFSEWFRRFEKGLRLKILVGSAALLGMGFIIFTCILLWRNTHQ
jgi:hypothetical protein